MLRTWLVLACLLMAGAVAAQGPSSVAEVVLASASVPSVDVVALLGGQRQSLPPDADFVKLHLHFDKPVKTTRFELEACEKPFSDGLDVYADYDRHFVFVEGGKKTLVGAIPAGGPISSLTFNLRFNRGACLAALRLFEGEKAIAPSLPGQVEGTVQASGVLKPELSYGPERLFDSRFENAWGSDGKATGVSVSITFAKETAVSKLRIWNGYQRSDSHFGSNSRAKTISVSGDGGFNEKIPVADKMGAQDVALPKAFRGRSLKLEVEEAHEGRVYKDQMLSEVRFFDGEKWFGLKYAPMAEKSAQAIRSELAEASVDDALDHSLAAGDGKEKWVLRLRSDGSIFMRGHSEDMRFARSYFAVGNFEILEKGKAGAKIRVYGFRKYAPLEMDSDSCGRACNVVPDRSAADVIFQDTFRLRRSRDGYFRFENVGPKASRKLLFRTLRLRRERPDD